MTNRRPLRGLAYLLALLSFTPMVRASAANLPLPPAPLRDRLANDDFVIVEAAGAGAGVMGAKKTKLQFATEPYLIKAKWKAATPTGDSWNDSPPREIGAYAAQFLFLDDDRYIVPPVVARCIALDTYKAIDAAAQPTFPGTRCVYGALAAWLDNVKQPDSAYDEQRFRQDWAYATSFANLNLLHYLTDNRDARASNFLQSTDPADPRLFSIDNGIAFGGVLYNFFMKHFNEIHVPLPAASIARLRKVTRRDLDRLAVLGQLEKDSAGILRNVPPGANISPDENERPAPWGLQFGLTRAQLDAIAERLRILLSRIDAGEIRTF